MKKKTLPCCKALSVLLLAFMLAACRSQPVQVNLIKTVELSLNNTHPTLGVAMTVHVNGSGTCSGILVDWGDDTTEFTGACADNSGASSTGEKLFQCDVTHTYSGWAGGKTVTAMVGTDRSGQRTTCEGRANLRFTISPPMMQIGFARPGPNRCDAVPNRPAVANRTLVKITTVPTSTRCGGIWYQNENPHCYDAEGGVVADATSDPTSRFPFQGMRKFSLVMSVGTQMVQGGTNVQFTTNQSGPLMFCINEPDPMAGTGGYQINISTDQLGPP